VSKLFRECCDSLKCASHAPGCSIGEFVDETEACIQAAAEDGHDKFAALGCIEGDSDSLNCACCPFE